MHQLDIPASVNSRCDLVIQDKKISGSAYRLTQSKAYHHGTMLIDSDLKKLSTYLKSDVNYKIEVEMNREIS